jgi:hypothetical protein
MRFVTPSQVLIQPAGHREHLEQRLAPEHLVAARSLDRAADRDALGFVLLDEHGDLRVADVALLEECCEPTLEVGLGQPPDDQPSEQRHADRPVVGNADGLVQLFHVEDPDLQEVLAPDAVVGTVEPGEGARQVLPRDRPRLERQRAFLDRLLREQGGGDQAQRHGGKNRLAPAGLGSCHGDLHGRCGGRVRNRLVRFDLAV